MSNDKTTKMLAKQAMTFSANGHKRAALYARVSQEEQAGEGKASIPEQLSEMRGLCNRNGWEIVGEFIDDKDYKATQSPKKGKIVNPSGERADRPQFLAMLERIKTGEVDLVLCWRDDRLVRHPRVASALEDALDLGDKARGNQKQTLIIDATGAQLDRFVLHIKAVIGREENKRRVERTKMGKLGTLKVGRWPGNYNRLGYSATKEPGKRGKVIQLAEPHEVQLVKSIFKWCDDGVTIRGIHRKLTAQSAEQKGSHRKRHYDWPPSLISQILACEDYTGKATWHFEDGTEYSIEIPQIITPEQWKRVQKRRAENRKLSTRNATGIYLLQGILYCGECKGKVGAAKHTFTLGRKKADGTRKRYELEIPSHSYRCNTARNFGCCEVHPHPYSWAGARLDWEVWRFIVDNGIKHPELICERVLARQADLQAQGDNVDGAIAHARQMLATVDQERANYQRQQARGKITEEEFDQRIQETNEARQHWNDELVRFRELRDNTAQVQTGLDYVSALMATIQERLPQIDQTPDELNALPIERRKEILKERQTIVRALCDKVTVWSNWHVEIEGLLDGSEATKLYSVSHSTG